MSFLSRKSLAGKMLMGLGCVAVLTLLAAATRPFEPTPQATLAAKPASSATVVANAAGR